MLRGEWKNEQTLARARAGFDVVYARQHGTPHRQRQAPPPPQPKHEMSPQERAEAQRSLQAAIGLLNLEGTLPLQQVYEQVVEWLLPGPWCTEEAFAILLRNNKGFFKVLASGMVASPYVRNARALAKRKAACPLPTRQWTLEEALAAASEDDLSPFEARIQDELRALARDEISVRTIQRGLRQGFAPESFAATLAHNYLLDPSGRQRAAELIEELSQHTVRWELCGHTPAEMERV